MKNIVLFILIIVIGNVSAQNDESSPLTTEFKYHQLNTFYLVPANFTFKNIEFAYERFLPKNNGILLRGNVGYEQNRFNDYVNTNKFLVANIELSYRKYIIYNIINKNKVKDKEKQNLVGLYLSPFVGYQLSQRIYGGLNLPLENIKNHSIIGGIYLGTRFDIAKGRITIDTYIGAGIKGGLTNKWGQNHSFYNDREIYQLNKSGFVPKGNVSIGFNF